jgi:hypothetical protein
MNLTRGRSDILKPFDIDSTHYYELFVYNAEEIAEGTHEPKLVNTFYEETLPSLEKINSVLQTKGYDTFELVKITHETSTYTVK